MSDLSIASIRFDYRLYKLFHYLSIFALLFSFHNFLHNINMSLIATFIVNESIDFFQDFLRLINSCNNNNNVDLRETNKEKGQK